MALPIPSHGMGLCRSEALPPQFRVQEVQLHLKLAQEKKKKQSYLLPITSLGELTYFKMLWAAHGSMSDSQHLSGGVNVALSL